MAKLTNREKELLDQVDDLYVQKILYFVCTGEATELTPLACESLVERYVRKQNECKQLKREGNGKD